MRKYSNVKTQLVDYICDKCNKGKMEYTGKMIFTYPEQYEHRCNHCGDIVNLPVHYPEIAYTYINE